MLRILLPLALVVLFTASLVWTQPQPQSTALAFTHVTVIDATGASPKPDMTVIVTGNRITKVSETARVGIPEGAEIIDASGKFLIPGLWDMHVHYLYPKPFLALFAANGVTGARVMWGLPYHFELRKEIQSGSLLGPRLVIASKIVDGPRPIWPGSLAVANEAAARKAVIKSKQQGADFVKVYSLLPRAAYFAIADESRKQGLPFAGHVPNSVSAAEASDAGQKSIEHLTGILAASSSREAEWHNFYENASNRRPGRSFSDPAKTRPVTRMVLDSFNPQKATALFQRLKRNHTWQCPTLTVLRSTAFLNDSSFRNDPRLKYLPPGTKSEWNPANDFRFKQRTAEDYKLSKLIYRKQIEIVRMMNAAGVEFLAGTDEANPYCFPGFSLHDELELLVQAGLTPMQALQAATINPARYLGNEKEMGTIEEGKLADLVLLDANPLNDIRNTTRINSVVLNGRLLDRKALDQSLADVAAAAKK